MRIFATVNYNRPFTMDEANTLTTSKRKLNLDAPIGDIIRQIRESQRYSQSDIARMINKSRNHISDIEAIKGYPSYAVLVDILRVLGFELTVRKIKRRKKSGAQAPESGAVSQA